MDNQTADSQPHLQGTVIRSTGSWYEVHTDQGVVPSRIRGKFRLNDQSVTNPIAVGDRVTVRLCEDDTGFITDIHERNSKLSRQAASHREGEEHVIAANIDAAWCVQAVKDPSFRPEFTDRFLVMAELFEIPAGIIINKIDLIDHEELQGTIDDWKQLYSDLGYTVLLTSAFQTETIEQLREALYNQLSVITGPSGVGKSTLLNKMQPDLDLETHEVSEKARSGQHTTTYPALYPLTGGGYVVDTPGIHKFGIAEIEPSELAWHFVEMIPFIPDCHFPSCTHDHEPKCAVKDALNADDISQSRYDSYIKLLHELQERHDPY